MASKWRQHLERWKRDKTRGPTTELHGQVGLSTRSVKDGGPSNRSSSPPPSAPLALSSIQPTSADTGTTLHLTLPLPRRLWDHAYDSLKDEDPKLVNAYERLLSRELGRGGLSSTDEVSQKNEIDQTNPETRQTQFEQLLQVGLEKTKKEAAVKQNIQGAMDIIDSLKGCIDEAVRLAPEAAIPWTSVCFALEILTNPITEAVANRNGISYVVSRMRWYWSLSHLLEENPSGNSSGLRGELEDKIIDLYKNLLSYQMKSTCLYHRNRLLVVLRDVVKLDDWESTLESIKDIERTIERDYDTFTNSEINGHLRKLAITAESMYTDIYRAIQDHTVTQRYMEQKEKDNECLAALRVTDPRDDKKRISASKGGLHRDSSNWILEHNDFRKWRNNDDVKVLWIKGDPGKGKTMLLIAIVDELEKIFRTEPSPSTVLSYFFCQATNTNLNSATAVMRGLIYRLCDQKPSLVSHLREKYDKSGQKLFDDENAFFALSGVLVDMLHDDSLSKAYIVIDALDECEKGLEQLLKFIVNNSSALPHIKWVISSRNRHDIERQLRLRDSGMKLSLELMGNAEEVSRAVNAYIDFKLHEVSSLQDNSKLKTQVGNIMRQKASGTFLWVALVIQQLENAERWDVLKVLEGLPPDLNGIYDRMMVQIAGQGGQKSQFCTQVLSAATVAYRPLRLVEMAVLSELPDEISSDSRNINDVVAMCGSFLTVLEGTVYLVHQSAKDYLSREMNSNSFSPKLNDVHRDIFSRSLRVMTALKRDNYNLEDPGILISDIKTPNPDPLAAMRYSCVYWIDHICDFYSDSQGPFKSTDGSLVGKFLREKFIYWLEAMGLIRQTGNAVLAISRLEILLKEQSTDHRLLEIVYDSRRFILQNVWVVENAPLQTYASALIFSPLNCLTRKRFQNEEPEWIRIRPRVDASWSPCLQTLEGHKKAVISVAFSDDSKLLAVGAGKRISIWNIKTRFQEQVHDTQSDIRSLLFSHDSNLLFSILEEGTIKIWDIKKGSLQHILKGTENTLTITTALSHDSRLLVTGSFEGELKVWDLGLRVLKGKFETRPCCSATLSHDSKLLALGFFDGTIQISDPAEIEPVHRMSNGEVGRFWIEKVITSHDSRLLASMSEGTVRIWDTATGLVQQTLGGDHNSLITFSRDSKLLVCQDYETLKIWDTATWSTKQTLPLDHRAFMAGHYIEIADFDNTGLYLDTNIGRIELANGAIDSTIIRAPDLDPRHARCYGYGLNGDQSWITWNERNILWLPPEYRVASGLSNSYVISSRNSPSTGLTDVIIAIGCSSGKVIIIGLNSSGPFDK